MQTTQDRMEIARVLVEFAERAERNPTLQNTLRKMELPAPFNVIEYVKPGNRRGYWARKSYSREHPSVAQAQARLEFSEINYSLFGTKGTVERSDGTRIGRVNFIAGELMRSRKIISEEEKADRQKQRAIERLVQVEHFR
ncbi:MAG: hypothetical protein Q7J35_02385 [Candidatus Methanoperedens sp.]|nr:hypothetical protein [Candidatus Methanoperedens sp.]